MTQKLDFHETLDKCPKNKNNKHKVVLWTCDSRGQKNKNTLPVCVSKRDSADKSKVEQIFVPRQEMYIGKKLHRIAVWYMKKLDAQLTAPPLQLCLCYYYVQKKMELECFNTFCTSTSTTASTLYFHVSLSLCSLFFLTSLGCTVQLSQ